METKTETLTGANCTLSDGLKNRVLTLSNTGLTENDGLIVIVGNSGLANGNAFTINHLSSNSTITFLNEIFDSQDISITYQQESASTSILGNYQESTENFDGSDCSGTNGSKNRVLTLTNVTLSQSNLFAVYVSGLRLGSGEYTVSHKSVGTTITFLNELFDDSLIVVDYYTEKEGQTSVGSSGNDFVDGPLSDLGVTVTRTPVTVTLSNKSGQKTYSESATNELTAVFTNPNQNFTLDKSGLTETFDGKMFVRASETITKYDKITYNSNTYRVDKVTLKKFGSTSMFKSVGMFFIE